MKQQIINRFILVLVIALLGLMISTPISFYENTLGSENFLTKKLSQFKISLGLDLQGGTELDYKVDLSEIIARNLDDDPANDVSKGELNTTIESVRDALEERVNPAGVGETIVRRSSITVNGETEEHILIQMSPDTDVDKAKADAELDNRLEFFEEDPTLEKKEKLKIAAILADLNTDNFLEKAKTLAEEKESVTIESFGPFFKDEIEDKKLADDIFATGKGKLTQKVIETTINPVYTVKDGQIAFDGIPYPRRVFAIAKVTDKVSAEREQKNSEKRKARHILFGYPEAAKADKDIKYKSKEEAKAKALEVLAQLKKEGTEKFGDLAKEFSTEGAAQRSFGELGEFGKGQMVPPFEEAVFKMTKPGLIPDLVETDFGFHIIEVEKVIPEETKTTTEDKVSYDLIVWDKTDMNWVKTELGGKQLDKASVGYDEINQPVVNLRFDKEGGKLFGELTEKVAARKCGDGQPCRMGIKVGGKFITTPTVREKIIGRNAQISGNFTFDSAHELADGLNLGAIDLPVILSGQTTIGAELGHEQLSKSLKAGMMGLIATMIFMIFVYRLSGVIASIVLIIYTVIFITILKTYPESFGGPIVLSLSGAAGIALSIGLAVDGNILIFERMKEEMRKGRTLTQAVDLGFERAWTAIRDSNVTTLLICTILFVIGSSIIKGFAITLIVGTLLSMFTAIIVSRNLMKFILLFPVFQKSYLYGVAESEIGKKISGVKIRKRKKKKSIKK